MKDIVIKQKDVKRELWIFLACFVISYGCNIYAIIQYDRPLTELYSTIGFVIAFAIVIYLVLGVARIVVKLLTSCIKHLTGRGRK